MRNSLRFELRVERLRDKNSRNGKMEWWNNGILGKKTGPAFHKTVDAEPVSIQGKYVLPGITGSKFSMASLR
jgi:hypothetical protein